MTVLLTDARVEERCVACAAACLCCSGHVQNAQNNIDRQQHKLVHMETQKQLLHMPNMHRNRQAAHVYRHKSSDKTSILVQKIAIP